MGVFEDQSSVEEDMARPTQRTIDRKLVDETATRLKAALLDSVAFGRAYDDLNAKGRYSSAELVEIARGVTGLAPKSGKAALQAIGQEHLRRIHQRAKGESAAKARVW